MKPGAELNLLDDIIDGASSAEVRLAVLLRKALVLASQLKNATFKEWCVAELDGYALDSELPPYRSFQCHSLGFFVGFDRSTMNRQPLPLAVLKPKHQDVVREVRITPGIAELEATIANGEKTLSSPWAPNMTVVYQNKFYDGWVLNRAWREFPTARLVGICDTVRNKLLRLALELREEVGDSDRLLNRITPEQVEAKVVNYIFGGQNVIGSAIGGGVAQASNEVVDKDDFA